MSWILLPLEESSLSDDQRTAVEDSLRVYDPQGRRRLGEDQGDSTMHFDVLITQIRTVPKKTVMPKSDGDGKVPLQPIPEIQSQEF